MAGAILRFKDEGLRVGVLDLTDGEPTPHGDRETRAKETAAATAILGLDWRDNLGLPNRSLEHTLETRRQLAGVIRRLRPRWLFAPYWVDAHPDHTAAVELIEAARFWAKLSKSDLPGQPHHPERIFHYFCVHLRQVVTPAFVLDISPYWERKLAALRCYASQFWAGRADGSLRDPSSPHGVTPPHFLDRQRDQAAYFGSLIGAAYGEPFASREPLGLSSLAHVR